MAAAEPAYQLVLLRHGESEWNKLNVFTGWVDVPLSDKGKSEASRAGAILKENGFEFDLAFTSKLRRAIQTLWSTLDVMDMCYVPVVKSWRLNERHYGALQGLNKSDTAAEHGAEQVHIWRRSYDIPPPELDESSEYWPGNDPRYADVDPADLPKCECLKDTLERFLPFWESDIRPALAQGKRVIVAAHGNSLRSLVKHLDGIADDVIPGVNIPTGVPLVYDLDADFKPIPHPDAVAPLSGRYLGDAAQIAAEIEATKNQAAVKNADA